MAFDIDEFRRNYPDAMAALCKFEGWTDADLDECDAAVAAAYERAEQHELQCWAKWIWLLALRMRRWRREKAEVDWVSIIPLMTPDELEQLERDRAGRASVDRSYRGQGSMNRKGGSHV